ncbi:MAG: hypothetical protein HYX74_02930 [Acidobacteria bacterium]|nr:hypothetical protein [Acidobacteriota bacterium]
MTMIYIILGIVLVAAVLYWGFRSEQKEAHHLDGLHITPQPDQEKRGTEKVTTSDL